MTRVVSLFLDFPFFFLLRTHNNNNKQKVSHCWYNYRFENRENKKCELLSLAYLVESPEWKRREKHTQKKMIFKRKSNPFGCKPRRNSGQKKKKQGSNRQNKAADIARSAPKKMWYDFVFHDTKVMINKMETRQIHEFIRRRRAHNIYNAQTHIAIRYIYLCINTYMSKERNKCTAFTRDWNSRWTKIQNIPSCNANTARVADGDGEWKSIRKYDILNCWLFIESDFIAAYLSALCF